MIRRLTKTTKISTKFQRTIRRHTSDIPNAISRITMKIIFSFCFLHSSFICFLIHKRFWSSSLSMKVILTIFIITIVDNQTTTTKNCLLFNKKKYNPETKQKIEIKTYLFIWPFVVVVVFVLFYLFRLGNDILN